MKIQKIIPPTDELTSEMEVVRGGTTSTGTVNCSPTGNVSCDRGRVKKTLTKGSSDEYNPLPIM